MTQLKDHMISKQVCSVALQEEKTEKSCCGMFLVKNCTISHFQKKVEFNSLFMTQMSQLKDHMRQSGK